MKHNPHNSEPTSRHPNPTYVEHVKELVILPFAIAGFVGFVLLLEWGLSW